MDGKEPGTTNVFVERLWRTIKYEEVYLHAYTSVPEARTAIARYLIFYDTGRPHSSLDRKTPDQAYSQHAEANLRISQEPSGSMGTGLRE
ncbi:MAG: transposase [Mesorhizobium sp.]|nr:MAG: transposase [Mesorhizobium sp.]